MNHSLSQGEALEDAVRQLLNGRLPEALGVTHGEIVDRHGNHSGQVDVVIFDRNRTPRLYTSGPSGHQVIPAEGVLAVVEVKTRVEASSIPGVVKHMQTIKKLERSAYHARPMHLSMEIYGASASTFPILYSLFAFESGSPHSVVASLKAETDHLPLSQRIDCGVILDPGYAILNATFRAGGPSAKPLGSQRNAFPRLPTSQLFDGERSLGLVSLSYRLDNRLGDAGDRPTCLRPNWLDLG